MRRLLMSLSGVLVLFAVPALGGAPAMPAPAAMQRPIEQVRMVRRCRVVHVWRYGPHGRHLVPKHRCHWVRVR